MRDNWITALLVPAILLLWMQQPGFAQKNWGISSGNLGGHSEHFDALRI